MKYQFESFRLPKNCCWVHLVLCICKIIEKRQKWQQMWRLDFQKLRLVGVMRHSFSGADFLTSAVGKLLLQMQEKVETSLKIFSVFDEQEILQFSPIQNNIFFSYMTLLLQANHLHLRIFEHISWGQNNFEFGHSQMESVEWFYMQLQFYSPAVSQQGEK